MDFNVKINYEDITEIAKKDLKLYIDAEFQKKQDELFLLIEEKKEQEKNKALEAIEKAHKEKLIELESQTINAIKIATNEITTTICQVLNINDPKKQERTKRAIQATLSNWSREVLKK